MENWNLARQLPKIYFEPPSTKITTLLSSHWN